MDSIADVVESADNDGAAVGVAHEHDSIEVFEQDLVHDIVDVSAQTHVGVNWWTRSPMPARLGVNT